MDLSKLKPAKGSTQTNRRLGRGVGSGTGGHSSTKGTKGQLSRSGASIPAGFEGGQMPLQRRLPKYGFTNKNFGTTYQAVNVARLAALVADGRIDPETPVTAEQLVEVGVAQKSQKIKILGDGTLDVALDITAHAFSKSAEAKITDAGGSVTHID
ncbi:MAG: 50S ribosomal protein L15 [Bacteroidetes bacterium]|jgi:large subunit ribosomal protein L15|nr:50S ribosomal protein L15 [Bacteroidota bacterium]